MVEGLASAVQALAVVLTGTVGLIGLFFTWQNLKQTRENTDRQLAQVQESTQRTLELTEQGQITERFTRAIDQLGATDEKTDEPRLEIRLGGIYALERIDKDSPGRSYHTTVMEVLTAYVRENSRQDHEKSATPTSRSNKDTEQDKGVEQQGEESPVSRPPTADIQAILDVLNRREEAHVPEQHRVYLDLHKANLAETNLAETNLSKANLQGADLRGAYLVDANLKGAHLRGANLQGAILSGADLQGAFLIGVFLREAQLAGANLQEANLAGVDLQGSRLQKADLRKALLDFGANLQKVFLQGADLRGGWPCPASGVEQERRGANRDNQRAAAPLGGRLVGDAPADCSSLRTRFSSSSRESSNQARSLPWWRPR